MLHYVSLPARQKSGDCGMAFIYLNKAVDIGHSFISVVSDHS